MPWENGVYVSHSQTRQRGQKGGFADLAATVKVMPLTQWPGQRTAKRKWSSFKAAWGTSCGMLAKELRQLRAKDAVLQVEIESRHFRNDGLPRSDAPTSGPGVVLSFTHPVAGALMYPSDRYDDWRDNVHALALSLEALRAVDRHGVTRNAEQYRGWKALPASTESPMDREEAARVILAEAAEWAGPDVDPDDLLSDPLIRKEAIREALKRVHPDTGGNVEAFHRVQRARKALEGSA